MARGKRKSRHGRDGAAKPATNGAPPLMATVAPAGGGEDPLPPKPPLAPGVKYRRILLKLSGEALMGGQEFGIDQATLAQIADELIDVHSLGVDIALVI